MHIHFVCEGNTYRSRLAEAYCNAHLGSGHKATSSGVHATDNVNGPITWVAALLIKRNGLVSYMKNGSWTQTDAALLKGADLIVFMDDKDLQAARHELGYAGDQHEVWSVQDIQEKDLASGDTVPQVVAIAERTLEAIKEHVDRMMVERKLGK